jgi:alanine or glycine:cation symporter, AGCS family
MVRSADRAGRTFISSSRRTILDPLQHLSEMRFRNIASVVLLWVFAAGAVLPVAAQQQGGLPEHENPAVPQPAPVPESPAAIAQPDSPMDIPPITREQPAADTVAPGGFMQRVDDLASMANAAIGAVFFADVLFFTPDYRMPVLVLWLVLGAIFFTVRMGFINFRGFGHAIQVVRGKYSNPADEGEVSHFQALTTALSATVGLGNIAGVAIAVSLGGPGATFWMIMAGLLGMSSKFAECTLGQQYREVRPDGRILGGPMQYLSKGLAEKGMGGFGKVLAVMFAILCIGGSFGGGNAFQVNQSLNALQENFPLLSEMPWLYGLSMAIMVGIVIIGGLKRIANVASKVVPVMGGIYIAGALVIILLNFELILPAFGLIFGQAFSPDAAYGGFIGVLVVGFQRAAFSNEAGIGSAPIAHSAARTPYPVREGIVALLEPFIDTVVVCTMTALVIVITGAYINPEYAALREASAGAALTSRAFGEEITWFPYVLSVAVLLFAYSTMISWSYYGERCWAWLLGDKTSWMYRLLFLVFVFLGSIVTSTNVLDLSDLMILGMAFPNILGVVLLSGKVRSALKDYWEKYQRGEFPVYK